MGKRSQHWWFHKHASSSQTGPRWSSVSRNLLAHGWTPRPGYIFIVLFTLIPPRRPLSTSWGFEVSACNDLNFKEFFGCVASDLGLYWVFFMFCDLTRNAWPNLIKDAKTKTNRAAWCLPFPCAWYCLHFSFCIGVCVCVCVFLYFCFMFHSFFQLPFAPYNFYLWLPLWFLWVWFYNIQLTKLLPSLAVFLSFLRLYLFIF